MKDLPGLHKAVRGVSDPASPTFRKYVTPEDFADRFGASPAEYLSVITWAQSHRLSVATHRGRLALEITGTVADLEPAINVRFNYAQRPDGTEFYLPDAEPSVDEQLPIAHFDNIDNYRVPKANALQGSGACGNGNGNTCYQMKDLVNAYTPGFSGHGSGQSVAILDAGNECFLQGDINVCATNGGWSFLNSVLQNNVPACGPGLLPGKEITLDIEMVTAMAPLATIQVFGTRGASVDAALNSIADDPSYESITSSFSFPVTESGEVSYAQFALQGQSFFQSSGDAGAYTTTNSPDGSWVLAWGDEEAVTLVGGTDLFMNGTGASYSHETAWNDNVPGGDSGGGIMANGVYAPDGSYQPGLPIPWYQEQFVTKANGASATWRNAPDVSAVAKDVQVILNGAAVQTAGTSVATPLWAGFIALVNEQAASSGYSSVGFANPMLYALGSEDLSVFHDVPVISGSSGSNPTSGCQPINGNCVDTVFYTQAGYDLVTGFGSMGPGLLGALSGMPDWEWALTSTSPIPSAITSFAESTSGKFCTIWAIDDSSWSGTSPDHQIWCLLASTGAWSKVQGGALQIVVAPNGTPWIRNSAGTVFSSPNGGASWTALTSGNPPPMRWIGVGPNTTNGTGLWGITTTPFNSVDYTIWYTDTNNAWSSYYYGGGAQQVAVAPDTGIPWIVNHNGTVFVALNFGSWFAISSDGYVPWAGTAKNIAVGPNNAVWVLNGTPWKSNNHDHEIFALVAYNQPGDVVFLQQFGGAVGISVSSDGTPSIFNTAGAAYIGYRGEPSSEESATVTAASATDGAHDGGFAYVLAAPPRSSDPVPVPPSDAAM